MPNYTYKCTNEFCDAMGQPIEIKIKIFDLDTTIVECDCCEKVATRVIASPANVQYKGDGFATTDDPRRM